MHLRKIPNWLWTATALLLGFALRCWFVTHLARIAGDTLIYGEIAKNWMAHNVYGFIQVHGIPKPTLIRLPGYPLFLLLCFRIFGPDSYTAVLFIQSLIDLGTCLLVSALAGDLFGPRARIAALWLACLCPFTATYVASPLTETLTIFCIALALYSLHRWNQAGRAFNRWLFLLAAALGYAILLRPEQGLLSAAILPALLWLSFAPRNRVPPLRDSLIVAQVGTAHQRDRTLSTLQKCLPALTVSFLTLLPLLPWTIRNHRTFHVFQPLAPRYATDPGESVPLDFQRWYRTWAIEFCSTEDIYWNYDDVPVPIANLPDRAFDSDAQYTRTAVIFEDYNDTSNDSPALEARFKALADERIADDPLRYYILLPVARLFNMILRPRVEMFPIPLEWWKYREHRGQTLFAAAYAALNALYLILAANGLWLWHRRKWADIKGIAYAPLVWAMLASILLRCALLLTIDNSEPRYTLEFFPILFLLAAIPFATQTKTPLSGNG